MWNFSLIKNKNSFVFLPFKILYLMRFFCSLISFCCVTTSVFCQNVKKDSIIELKEVIISEKRNDFKHEKAKTIDNSLQEIKNLNLIKRGVLSWEPFLNDMSQERTTQTISGMRLFTACPDKMDSVHSYLEGHNLNSIDINSSNEGFSFGATIGGNINFQLKKTDFSSDFSLKGEGISSFRSNNEEFFLMAGAEMASPKTSGNISFSRRNAKDYISGAGQIINFSGYRKYNVGFYLQQKLSKKSIIFSHFIFDQSLDVGYPSLAMDAEKAQGIIWQMGAKTTFNRNFLKEIKTHFYGNVLHHLMSDKLRPVVPFRMDMPSKSQTFGASAEVLTQKDRLSSTFKIDVFHNFSLSEMIMYYHKGGTMRLFTLPEIRALNGQIFLKNTFKISENQQISLSTAFFIQKERLGNLLGKIFYPEMKAENITHSPLIGLGFSQKFKHLSFEMSSGYGKRPPSFTERYGFYVFNNYDGFEYIGNPFLTPEISFDTSLKTSIFVKNTKISAQASYFYIEDYIVGKIFRLKGASPMMYGSTGLKNYQALPFVRQLNANLSISRRFFNDFLLQLGYKYSFGRDFEGEILPFIPPKSYFGQISYKKYHFDAIFSFLANEKKQEVSKYSGEKPTKAYFLLNFETNYHFNLKKIKIKSTFGVENIFNQHYTTYATWNKIPQMGRSFLVKVETEF